ncbi:hypothetical protein GCM10010244_38150 [Streptomyces coeruleorubidus]|nr:hypothetical protein GCM10010244_38150 [Streptomyces bellus]
MSGELYGPDRQSRVGGGTVTDGRAVGRGEEAALDAERCLAARNATQDEQEPAAVPA